MLQKLSGIAFFAILALNMALAQDATKAEPNHYKLAFENDYVQVVNVHYGPHEKTKMHSHPGGVVVNITGGHMRFTDEHGVSREVRSLPGEARWFPPFHHSVENLEDVASNSVYVGIKNYHPTTGNNGQPIIDAHTKELVAQALALAVAKQ